MARNGAISVIDRLQAGSALAKCASEPGFSLVTPHYTEAQTLEPVRLPGGDPLIKIIHPNLTIFERLYRKLPEEGFYSPSLNPRSPLQFEIGSFAVPPSQHLWIFDYQFSVYRQSGIDPGDTLEAEEGRFGGFMGFDFVFNGTTRMTDINFELDPSAIGLTRDVFASPGPANPDQFNRAATQSFASNASPGTSLLPVRSIAQGPRGFNFYLVAPETTRVAMNCIIFRTVATPLSFIQARCAGYLVDSLKSRSIINAMAPR